MWKYYLKEKERRSTTNIRRVKQTEPNPVAVPCEAWVLIAGNADSNPTEGMHVCLLCLLCAV